ncbi:hypothetical protein SD78_0732 [Bacillus badius]|nr:hypothetical protein SD78_0732 [Bacillus badius]
MQEQVGTCQQCGRALYCLDGFFYGIKENGVVLCFECKEQEEENEV